MVQVDTLSGSDELLPSESSPLAWLLLACSLLLDDISLLLEGLILLFFLPFLFLSDVLFFSRSLSFFLSRSALSFSFFFSCSARPLLAFSLSFLSFLRFWLSSVSLLLLFLLEALLSLSGLARLFLLPTVSAAFAPGCRVLAFSLDLAFLLWWRCRLLAAASVQRKIALNITTFSGNHMVYQLSFSYFPHFNSSLSV